MDCIVAASTGALKGISLRDNSFTNLIPIKSLLPKEDEITSMIWSGIDQSEVLTAQMDRQLKLYDTLTNTFNPLFKADGGTGPVKGLHMSRGEKIITCMESGVVNVWSKDGKKCGEWKVGDGVRTMKGSDERNEIVTGGTKNLVKTWDIKTGKQTWSARNVPNDFLDLGVPVMCTDVCFISKYNTIVESTKLHEMRLYDPRAQRRPIKKINFMDVPITSVNTCYRDNHVLAANSIGEMGLFDLRSKVHPVCKYKGQSGSIRSIDSHPTAAYVATCGIDRFIRVHDIESRKLVNKIYCKTRLNRVLMRSELSILSNVKIEPDDEEWAQLTKENRSDDESEINSIPESSDSNTEYEELIAGGNEVHDMEPFKNVRKRKDGDIINDNINNKPVIKKKKELVKKKRKEAEVKDEICDEPEPRKKIKIAKGMKRRETIDMKLKVESSGDAPEKKRVKGK